MNPITHLLPEKLVTALGWTLLHSLWQGALIALLAGVALILLKKHSATMRYYVTLTAMATVFLLAVVTFLGCYSAERTGAPAVVYATAPVVAQGVGDAGGSVLPASIRTNFTNYFAGHFPLVVLLWAAGVLVLLLRLVGGLAYVARMKSYQVSDVDAHWQEKTASLAERLGLRRTARLVESRLAKVPMTIGYLKPVILLPLGALAGLSPTQVEAILAHELAHIRRHDYLINLVQSLLEILMFYHPAVWWLSARVREEREHCCDDMAVALCSDSVTFAKALVHLEEQYGKAPTLAMAATGRDGALMGRIKRLLAPGHRTPTFVEGFIVALVLLAGVGVVSVSAARPPENRTNLNAPWEGASAAPAPKPAATLSVERTAYYLQWADSTDRPSDVIIVKDKKGNIVELYVDGRRIPDKQIANYRQRIDQALAEQKKNRYSDSPERDVNRAFRRMEERNDDGSSWNVSGDLNVFPPLPPVEPMPPLPPMEPVPAIPPTAPMPPIPPMEPVPGMHFDGHFFDGGDEDHQDALRDALQNLEDDFVRQREEKKAEMERLERDFELNAEQNKDGKARAEFKEQQLDFRKQLEKMEEYYQRSRKSLKDQIDAAERETKGSKKGRDAQRERQNRQEANRREHSEAFAEANARSEAAMRGLTEQMKKNGDRMKEQLERMHEQTARMQEHAAQMEVHAARMKKHSDFMNSLNAQLKADGFLKENQNLDFEVKNGQLYINGQVQPDEVYHKYRKLFEAQDKDVFSKEPGDKDFQLRFQYKD